MFLSKLRLHMRKKPLPTKLYGNVLNKKIVFQLRTIQNDKKSRSVCPKLQDSLYAAVIMNVFT